MGFCFCLIHLFKIYLCLPLRHNKKELINLKRLLVSFLLFLISFSYVSLAAVNVNTTQAVYDFSKQALLFKNKTDEDFLKKHADEKLQPIFFEDTFSTANHDLYFIRNHGGYRVYAAFENNTDTAITQYFYLGNYAELSYVAYDTVANTYFNATQKSSSKLAKGTCLIPVKFKPHSYTRIWFYTGKYTTPGNKIIHYLMADNIEDINKKVIDSIADSGSFWNFMFPVFLLLGCLLCMLIFSFVYSIQTQQIVFVYYFFYLLFTFIYFFHRELGQFIIARWEAYFDPFLDITWQTTSYVFYYLFSYTFGDLKRIAPNLYKFVRVALLIVILYLSYDFILLYFDCYELRIKSYTWFRLAMALPSFISIAWAYCLKTKLTNFLATASLSMVAGAFAALITSAIGTNFSIDFFNYSMNFMMLGVLLEIMFFTFGLSYKTKMQVKENARVEMELKRERESKEVERLKTIIETQESERKRVSRELHDDLGSGLSTIRFLSEIGKTKPDSKIEMEKISHLSNDLVDGMRHIIWTMNPENSLWEDMVLFIKSYAFEFFEMHKIDLRFSVDGNYPQQKLSGEVRRNIFLVVKESLHNIVKHSHATLVCITISFNGKTKIEIKDNGTGINQTNNNPVSTLRQGVGLMNMKKRMEDTGGELEIENNNGTIITIQLPF